MEPIAIIGYHGRFPQSDTLDDYWTNLCQKRVCIETLPLDRWNESLDVPRNIYGGFLRDIDCFDYQYFGIAKQDAYLMDPHQRLFLETVKGSLESSGYGNLRSNKGKRIGVFASGMWHDFSHLAGSESLDSNLWSIANRASFHFDFTGPSVGIDTACSSALSGVHLACMSLREGECEMAVAGSVNLILHPSRYHYLKNNKHLSPVQQKLCFEPGQEGYIPSEGYGSVVLKRLSDAEKDGDSIYAVIQASGVNHSGRSFAYKSPSSEKLAELIDLVIRKAEVSTESLSYIELSAYGSQTADMFELMAVYKHFKKRTARKQFCTIGSLKPWFGHMEAAAGIAQLLKVIFMLKNKSIAASGIHPSLDSTFDLSSTAFKTVDDLTEWNHDGPLTAAISCVGGGGSNAFMILKAYSVLHEEDPFAIVPVCLSESDEGRLRGYLQNILNFIQQNQRVSIYHLAYTLSIGFEPLQERLVFIPESREHLIQLIKSYLNETKAEAMQNKPHSFPWYEAVNQWKAGGTFNWNEWFKNGRRISPPTRPMQKLKLCLSHYDGEVIGKNTEKPLFSSSESVIQYLRQLLRRNDRSFSGMALKQSIADYLLDFNSMRLIIQELKEQFPDIQESLLFQYRTVNEMGDYLFSHVNKNERSEPCK